MIILIIIGFAEEVAYVISKELKLHNSGLLADVIDSRYCNINQKLIFHRAAHSQQIREGTCSGDLYPPDASAKDY